MLRRFAPRNDVGLQLLSLRARHKPSVAISHLYYYEYKRIFCVRENLFMAIGKTIMDNSILPILPGLHATILSIFLAALVAFWLYSYQILDRLKEQLNDLRTQVAQIMSSQSYIRTGSIKPQEYLKNGTLDFRELRKELFFSSSNTDIPKELEKSLAASGIDLGHKESQIKENAGRILDIISLFAMSYPYSDRSSIEEKGGIKISYGITRLEYEAKWKADLISLNGYLSWFWEGRREEILKTVSQYREIHLREEIKQAKELQEKMIRQMKESAHDSNEVQELLQHAKEFQNDTIQRMKKSNQENDFYSSVKVIDDEIPYYVTDINYNQIVIDFFNRINFIQRNIIKPIEDYSYKLDFYENKFLIKRHLVFALVFSLIMLFAGIFLPLFINLYWKPPYIKSVEVGFLVGTLLPYFVVLFLFLKQTLEIKFR